MIKKLTKQQIASAAAIVVLLIISAVTAVTMWDDSMTLTDNSTHLISNEPQNYVSQSNVNSDNVSSETAPTTQNVQTAQKTEVVKYVRITETVRVREGDSIASKQVSQLTKGTEVKYISESSERYQVEYASGKNGWIVKSCGEVFDKTIIIKLLPEYISGAPIDMSGTDVGKSLSDILRKRNTVGASIAVIKNGQVAYHLE